MKNILVSFFVIGFLSTAFAQGNEAPFYLPGEGVYLVGLPSDLVPVVPEPTMVTQAYQAKFVTSNAELASVHSGVNSYNVSTYLNDAFTELDLTHFVGIGEASRLTVRDFEGNSYELGCYATGSKRPHCRLLAAYNAWRNHSTLPLCMYDQWDCPVQYDADPMLADGQYDAVSVNFGNPHEGLVVANINFPLAIAAGADKSQPLTVTLNMEDSDGNDHTLQASVNLANLDKVAERDGYDIYSVVAFVSPWRFVLDTPFSITVCGFAQQGGNVWIPRAVDTHGLYPTHTTYMNGQDSVSVESSDVCINLQGYFNYLGTYGWYDGKYERGEVVSSADLVQVYYDPADADWPGDYFMGEAAFPVECTFGASDITILEAPSWINAISYDESQWVEYGAIQIILSADALPNDLNGRNGKVVLITSDLASRYTIYLRQGAAWFDFGTGISNHPVVEVPQQGGAFDLLGRSIQSNVKGLSVQNNAIILQK